MTQCYWEKKWNTSFEWQECDTTMLLREVKHFIWMTTMWHNNVTERSETLHLNDNNVAERNETLPDNGGQGVAKGLLVIDAAVLGQFRNNVIVIPVLMTKRKVYMANLSWYNCTIPLQYFNMRLIYELWFIMWVWGLAPIQCSCCLWKIP